MTDQDIFDLRITIAQAFNAEQDASKKAELQKQLEFLQAEQERLLIIESDALVSELEGPIQRVEEIVRDLGQQDIWDALNRIQDRVGLTRLRDGGPQVPTTLTAPTATPVAPPAPVTSAPASTSTNNLVPESWLPDAPMNKVILHWTAGSYRAGGLDKFSYHILIEGDGKLVRGTFSIADNVSNLVWNPRSYAAHTKGTNTRSVGVSACCMAGARNSPTFSAGTAPMLELQWNRMVEVTAQLCTRYSIPVTDRTVLGHGEVQKNLGIAQSGKWDPMVLPWDLGASKEEVGERFRSKVKSLL